MRHPKQMFQKCYVQTVLCPSKTVFQENFLKTFNREEVEFEYKFLNKLVWTNLDIPSDIRLHAKEHHFGLKDQA